jgi:hypothetical protein
VFLAPTNPKLVGLAIWTSNGPWPVLPVRCRDKGQKIHGASELNSRGTTRFNSTTASIAQANTPCWTPFSYRI